MRYRRIVISLLITRLYNAHLKRDMKESTPLLWKGRGLHLWTAYGGIAQSFKAPIMSISDGLDELNSLWMNMKNP